MADEAVPTELERLRAEVEAHRQRELADLRSALADANARLGLALDGMEKWRSEAHRISQQGNALAMEAQRRETDLKTQLMAKANVLAQKTP
jgi:hypothetical protein